MSCPVGTAGRKATVIVGIVLVFAVLCFSLRNHL